MGSFVAGAIVAAIVGVLIYVVYRESRRRRVVEKLEDLRGKTDEEIRNDLADHLRKLRRGPGG
mgnify:CR=1 FL=1